MKALMKFNGGRFTQTCRPCFVGYHKGCVPYCRCDCQPRPPLPKPDPRFTIAA